MIRNSRTFSTLGLLPTGRFLVLHLFIALLQTALNGEQLCQGHAPVNSCTICTLGLPLAWLFLVLHLFIVLFVN